MHVYKYIYVYTDSWGHDSIINRFFRFKIDFILIQKQFFFTIQNYSLFIQYVGFQQDLPQSADMRA